MIKVYLNNLICIDEIKIRDTGREISIIIEGHSGFGEKGSDIVCSGISAIIQTSIIAITKVAKIRQNIEQRDGYLKSIIFPKGIQLSRLRSLMVILNTMVVGLREIMDSYPGSLDIIFEKKG